MASHPHRWLILAVVATAFFMTILDVSIVNVALPSIGRDLDFSNANLQWVITAYAITFGGFLLLGGRRRPDRPQGRLHGRRRALHGCLTRLRALAIGGNADRVARRAVVAAWERNMS
jgi:MFS family permease